MDFGTSAQFHGGYFASDSDEVKPANIISPLRNLIEQTATIGSDES
jgi:hypothetical protein